MWRRLRCQLFRKNEYRDVFGFVKHSTGGFEFENSDGNRIGKLLIAFTILHFDTA